MKLPASIDGVVEVLLFTAPGTRWVLIEVPHGATRTSDYERVASSLHSVLPQQLEHFFYVNTDIGAPEGAVALGQQLASAGINVVVARCLVPRTFIDTNRVVAKTQPGVVQDGLTPAVASYITAPEDIAWLNGLHARYHELVEQLYRSVCGENGGLALQLHSYAPRSVGIERTDENIVNALHAAYVPEVYEKWPKRPVVDLISATADGSFRAAPGLNDALLAAFAEAGIEAKENATYAMHPITMGYVYAHQFPQQVVCVELNRGELADPFTPFAVSPLSAEKVARLVAPIGKVLREGSMR